MAAYPDWSVLGAAAATAPYAEQIARTRLIERARAIIGSSVGLTEFALIDAAAAEVLAAGIIASTLSFKALGANGNDAGDNTAALNSAASGGPLATLDIGAGTYRFGTTPASVAVQTQFRYGAIFKPQAGVNVPISGPILAGAHQIFDTSLGGTFSFGKQRTFKAEWFGFGLGNDDGAILTALQSFLPDGSTVVWEQAMTMTFLTTWSATEHRHVIFAVTAPPGSVRIIWRGPYLGTMASWTNVDTCKCIGFTWEPNNGCATSLAGNITATQKTLSFTGYNPLVPEHAGRKVIVVGAGPAGADLVTIADTYNANGGDPTLTLHDAASVTVGPVRVIIGATATSGPPLIVHDIDQTGGNNATTTACEFHRNKAGEFGFVVGQTMWRVANTSVNNCESFMWYGNSVQGHFPVSDTVASGNIKVTTVAANPTITFDSNWATKGMIGGNINIPDGNGVGVPYSGKVIGVAGAPNGQGQYPQMVLSPAPTAGVAGKRAYVDDVQGIAIHVGPHSNSMKHEVKENNLFQNLDKAVWQEAGSINGQGAQFTWNRVDIQIDSASNSCVWSYSTSEEARQHMVVRNVGPSSPIVLIAPRLGTALVKANGRYMDIKFTSGGAIGSFTSIGTQFDDTLEAANINSADAFYWGLGAGKFTIMGTHYGTGAGTSTVRAGYTTLGNDAFLESIHEDYFTDSSSLSFSTSSNTVADNIAHSVYNARQAISARIGAPTDAAIQKGQVVFYEDSVTKKLTARRRRDDLTYQSIVMPEQAKGWVSPALAAGHMPIDMTAGDKFYGNYAGAVTVDNPTGLKDGDEFTVWLRNNGALVVTWGSKYFPGVWVDPAGTKTKSITFVYKLDFDALLIKNAFSGDA